MVEAGGRNLHLQHMDVYLAPKRKVINIGFRNETGGDSNRCEGRLSSSVVRRATSINHDQGPQ